MNDDEFKIEVLKAACSIQTINSAEDTIRTYRLFLDVLNEKKVCV